jgi:hypothetical protein
MIIPGIVAACRQNPEDPYWSQVVLAMHMDGDLIDQSGTVTVSGSGYSYTTGKFGDSIGVGPSIYVDTSASSDLRLDGPFTIEFWLKQSSLVAGTDSKYFMHLTETPGTGLGKFYFVANGGGNNGQLIFSFFPPLDSISLQVGYINDTTNFHHIAVVFDGTRYQGYRDGIKNGASIAKPALSFSADPIIHVGTSQSLSTGGLTVYIEDLRITKGVARYTDSFTPPIEAFIY